MHSQFCDSFGKHLRIFNKCHYLFKLFFIYHFFFLVYQKHFDEDDIVEGIMKAIGECKDDKMFSNLLSQICQPLAKNLLDLYEKYEKGLSGESHEQFNKVVFFEKTKKIFNFFYFLHLETLL